MMGRLTSYDKLGRNLCYLNEKQMDFLIMKDELNQPEHPSFRFVSKTHPNGPKLDLYIMNKSGLVVDYALAYVTPAAQHRICKRFRHRSRGAQHSKQWSANGMFIPFYP